MNMYNRYIPQTDGTYQRRKMPDQLPKPLVAPPHRPQEHTASNTCPPPEAPRQNFVPPRPRPYPPRSSDKNGNITSFFKRLLPKDFDAGDLMVVLLILLMAGDSAEDQNTALLTLALYLFL